MENIDRHIRYFLKVANLKSISKAADALELTQSGLSRQISALEQYLGKALFLRTGRGVELTEAGERLKEQVEPAYRLIDAALEVMREQEGVTRGTVRLATVHTLSYYFVGDVAARFISQHTGINLSIMGRASPEVASLVESGRADVGFVYDSAVVSPSLVATPLFDDDMCLIVQEGSHIGEEIDLTQELPDLVGFPAHFALRRMIHSSGLEPRFVAEAETVDVMLKLVGSGIGASILPARMPDALLADHRLRKVAIAKPMLRRRVVLIVRSGRAPSALVQHLVAIAAGVAG